MAFSRSCMKSRRLRSLTTVPSGAGVAATGSTSDLRLRFAAAPLPLLVFSVVRVAAGRSFDFLAGVVRRCFSARFFALRLVSCRALATAVLPEYMLAHVAAVYATNEHRTALIGQRHSPRRTPTASP